MNELINTIHFKRLIYKRKSYNQKYLLSAIDKVADYFSKNFRSNSPFIVYTAYNHIKTIITYYAIIKAGKIAVVLDPALRSLETAHIIEDTDPGAIVFLDTNSDNFDFTSEIIFRTPSKQYILRSDLRDVCTIAYTNGEDGFMKGAMLTEKNLMFDMHAFKATTDTNNNSVVCALLPFSHLLGLMQGILMSTHFGCSGVILDMDLRQINSFVNELFQHKVTHFYTVPSVYYLLAKVPLINKKLENIKMCVTGGTKLPEMVYHQFLSKAGIKIHEGYGLTECAPAVAGNNIYNEPVLNSLGKSFPGVEIQILDSSNKECKKGVIGEIVVKGDMVFKGYLNHSDATNESFINEWFRTGDLGYVDDSGSIYFTDVRKDMINVAGNNVYPKELQRLMNNHSNVRHVSIEKRKSALQGEVVVANVQLDNNTEASQRKYEEWLRKNISTYKYPKKINYL